MLKLLCNYFSLFQSLKSPVNKSPVIKEEPADSSNSFVVTPNYISQCE